MTALKTGIVVFPGSNCDRDAYDVFNSALKQDVEYIWHKDTFQKEYDIIILPGGFSYGDYLRSGAIAGLSPVMQSVIDAAEKGKIVIGICNGFQILCESGLLPGALSHNKSLKFICSDQFLKIEHNNSIFTSEYYKGDIVNFPIAHGEGNYIATSEVINELESKNRILFRYSDHRGLVEESTNPNGSQNGIAGIINDQGNVLGLMPHPERSIHALSGRTDGLKLFSSVINSLIHEKVYNA